MEAFFPWVGTNYNSGSIFGKKVFVLGESVYCEEQEECGACFPGVMNLCNYFIIHIVLNNMLGKYSTPLYTKIYRLMVDDKQISKEIFWNSISFGNYVQTSISSKARVRPTQEMWDNSQVTFLETLKRLEPDKMIILGNDLWNNLPGQVGQEWIKRIENEHSEMALYKCSLTKKEIDTAVIGHPQRYGFEYAESEAVRVFLEK